MGEIRIIDAMFVTRHGDNVSVLVCSDLSFRAGPLVGIPIAKVRVLGRSVRLVLA